MIFGFAAKQSHIMQGSRSIIGMAIGATAVVAVILFSTSVDGAVEMAIVALAVALLVVLALVLGSQERQSSTEALTGARSLLADAESRIAEAEDEIANLSNFDEVTGAYNERHFVDLLSQHRALAVRGSYFFSLAIIEVDQYPEVVESSGLGRGNEVLQLFSRIVKAALREVDVLARLDAERFALILSSASEEDAISIINRIGQLISQIQVDEADSVKITSTAGITSYHGTEEVADLMTNVDTALQAAVAEGRNLVAIYNYKEGAD